MVPSSSDRKGCWISFYNLSQVTQFPSLEKSYLTRFSCISSELFYEYSSNLCDVRCARLVCFYFTCILEIASYPRRCSFFFYYYIVFHLITLCSWSPLDEQSHNFLLLCSYKQCCHQQPRTLFGSHLKNEFLGAMRRFWRTGKAKLGQIFPIQDSRGEKTYSRAPAFCFGSATFKDRLHFPAQQKQEGMLQTANLPVTTSQKQRGGQ